MKEEYLPAASNYQIMASYVTVIIEKRENTIFKQHGVKIKHKTYGF